MIIKLEMGDGAVSKSPDVIISQGIGSCVVLILYDAKTKIGGLAHIMFPSLTLHPLPEGKTKTPSPLAGEGRGEGVFESASTALPTLLDEMQKRGCDRRDIVAKIIGGARMFTSYADIKSCVGEENITSIKQTLQKYKIPIAGLDIGGAHGRNVEFHLESGRVVVKAFGKEDKEI